MEKGRIITYESTSPYVNMAMEETLFLSAINSRVPVIRIWKNTSPCIYLGIGKKVNEDVFLNACKKNNIPVIRRFSGGGTVFHDKGNINFSFFLPLEKYPAFENLKNSYKEIFKILNSLVPEISLQGTSDFCINHKKISGNAQARKKNTMLHHGTLLVNLDINKISKHLKTPKEMPEYRNARTHKDFLTTFKKEKIKLNSKSLLAHIKNRFPDFIDSKPGLAEKNACKKILKEKYFLDEWNFRI